MLYIMAFELVLFDNYEYILSAVSELLVMHKLVM